MAYVSRSTVSDCAGANTDPERWRQVRAMCDAAAAWRKAQGSSLPPGKRSSVAVGLGIALMDTSKYAEATRVRHDKTRLFLRVRDSATRDSAKCYGRVEMSPLSKVEMSP